jgi:hypothetical protein
MGFDVAFVLEDWAKGYTCESIVLLAFSSTVRHVLANELRLLAML